jgi:CBS domain-containing protein
MNIATLMQRNVKCCRVEDTADTAAQLMWDFDIGALPVVDSQARVVGMITDRDICMAAYTQGRRLGELSVESAMARKVIAGHPHDDVVTARVLMADNQIRRLPVIDGDGRLAGIITIDDLAHGVEQHVDDGITGDEVAVTLATICTPRQAPAPLAQI